MRAFARVGVRGRGQVFIGGSRDDLSALRVAANHRSDKGLGQRHFSPTLQDLVAVHKNASTLLITPQLTAAWLS
jgi:hypothetical protein